MAIYIEAKGLEITFDTTVEEIILSVDADMFERVILNLISNAIKFTPSGGKIDINIFEESGQVVIKVADTGIGISAEDLDKVFNRFRQLDTPLHIQHEGSGIGLSLVRSIVEKHGGTINVDSEVGVGSVFIIKLPIDEKREISYEIAINEVGVTTDINIERINIEFSDIYSNAKKY